MKLVVRERETIALHAFLNQRRPGIVTSTLAVVEVLRAARIAGLGTSGLRRARERLDETLLVDIDRELVDDAVSFTSARVRSGDAIHLASALRVGAREMLVYDRRLAEAAEAVGLEVLRPGA
ncbi:MAG: type II toxin-antitoxin system VapC family toxin [Actinobacteria bacterium]|nr:type II toxin-antitoxin system VapC family toxin [Actinomycetota bacterium]